jgi:PPOX class probable F420-dependent enzyme
MPSIPEAYQDLFARDLVAHFSTLMPDGTPFVRPVWIDYDPEADRVLVNTERGGQKERNARRNPKVGVSVDDTDHFYRFISVRGEVTEITRDGAVEHIHRLTQRYLGREKWTDFKEDRPRVQIRIRPDEVVTSDD